MYTDRRGFLTPPNCVMIFDKLSPGTLFRPVVSLSVVLKNLPNLIIQDDFIIYC